MAAPTREMKTCDKTVFVAQQLHFANALAGNDPVQRARAMKKLRKFFIARAYGNFCFTHDDFMRLWKGLFYCMWMSDKPLIQEELAEQISQLIHCFKDVGTTLKFIYAFFDTLIIEWFGIDYHRLDKFQMFVRRFLRQSLEFCKNYDWHKKPVRGLCNIFKSTVLSPERCEDQLPDKGLNLHFVDIFIEELAKVSAGEFPKHTLLQFLKPFAACLVEQLDLRVRGSIRDKIFFNLIRQSPEGMEYEEKFEAWKRAGFPGSSWKDMVFVGKDDNRSGVKIKHLDPRAGKVNVYLPRLEFDARSVAQMIKEYSEKTSNVQRRNYILSISKKFQILSKGKYPLAMNISNLVHESRKHKFSKDLVDDAVEKLICFNKKLEVDNRHVIKHGRKMEKRKKEENTNGSKKSKKIKLEKSVQKENYENDSSEELTSEESDDNYSFSEMECGDENSSFNLSLDVVNGKKMHKKKRDLNLKIQPNNVHSLKNTKKKKKVKDTVASSVSEMPNLGEGNSNVEKSLKDIEVENEIDKDNLEIESTVQSESIHEKVEQVQIMECVEKVQKEKEIIELKEKEEVSSHESQTPHSSQENGNLEANEKLGNSSPEPGRHSPENGIIDVVQDNKEEESIVTELETPHNIETATVLRRSVRRRTNVVPETTTRISEKEGVAGLSVNSSTPKSVKKTPKQRLKKTSAQSIKKTSVQCVKKTSMQSVKSKDTISDDFSPIEVEWELEETEEQSQPSVQRETPVTKDKSTPLTGIRTADLVEQQIEKQEDSANVSAFELCSFEKELTVSDNNTVNEESKLTPRRINLRSIMRQSLSKKRASLNSTPLSSKKVNIALQMNCSQDFDEYIQTVSSSPMVPHDVNKKPSKGVLKRSSIKSPLNPFYKPPKGIWSVLPSNFE